MLELVSQEILDLFADAGRPDIVAIRREVSSGRVNAVIEGALRSEGYSNSRKVSEDQELGRELHLSIGV